MRWTRSRGLTEGRKITRNDVFIVKGGKETEGTPSGKLLPFIYSLSTFRGNKIS